MLASLGDLVDDIVVRLDGPVRLATDTAVRIERRRGGSAANVTATAARLGHRSRFLGQVGDDVVGRGLVAELAAVGVDVGGVRHAGHTGTIVVLVDREGERTMLTDRRACLELDEPEVAWLHGVDVLHVPLYSLVEPPLSLTADTLIGWAHERDIAVSIDVSSVALIDELGLDALRALLARLHPTVVFANGDEARMLHVDGPLEGAMTVVKHGPEPAVVYRSGSAPIAIPAASVARVADTTAAGDAFAAGFLTHGATGAGVREWAGDPRGACTAGHRAAADLLAGR
jgi:sugar/nucleoside kinase (ribokinase family)